MKILIGKLKKEFGRLRSKLGLESVESRERVEERIRDLNLPYEMEDALLNKSIQIPKVVSPRETVAKIVAEKCSVARFGDGEFSLMKGGGINFQKPSKALSSKLHSAIREHNDRLLVALPNCFEALDVYEEAVADFWRKWMVRKRTTIYSYLDMNRTYYSAFLTRAFMPYKKTPELYQQCEEYFVEVKKIWAGRDVVICEGEGTRFGLLNDLLSDSRSIRRILCPAVNAFDQYDAILALLREENPEAVILVALGPTATALAYDLSRLGYQVIDIGHLDVEYEWFTRKDEKGLPLEHKYVDGTEEGRRVTELHDVEYHSQIIKRIG